MSDFRPIFIVGTPRSGTSLLRVLLNRHPAVAICDETFFCYYVWERRRAFGDLRERDNRLRLVEAYLATWRIRRLGLDADGLRRRLLDEATSYDRFLAALLACYAERHGKPRAGEKTPHHAMYAQTLCRWYPAGILLHVVRDPRDVVASLLDMPWSRRSVVANARLWVQMTGAAIAAREHVGYYRLRYEDLVRRPGRTLRAVCSTLGEGFVPEMLLPADDTEQADRPWFRRAHERVTSERIGNWRRRLSPGQARIVERIAGPLMNELGYEGAPAGPGGMTRTVAAVQWGCDAVVHRARRLPAAWRRWTRPTHLAAEERRIDRI